MAIKVGYYIKRFGYNLLPRFYFKKRYHQLKRMEKSVPQTELNERLNYYCKITTSFPIPQSAVAVKDFNRSGKKTNYYLDFKEFLHYFKPHTQFSYHFGDETFVKPFPVLFKARPINDTNSNSVLFKLNKERHFKWVKDDLPFIDKKNMLVWRGGAYQPIRKAFVKQFYTHSQMDVGQVNHPIEDVPWQKKFLSIEEQLRYKFIFCPEGNDVATNLKWVMSSNSLAIMPKPTKETWFMEGTLKSGIHYVEVKNDFSDLEEKMNYYSAHPEKANDIIAHAHAYVKQFMNKDFEDLLCLKVLEKYAELTGQSGVLRF